MNVPQGALTSLGDLNIPLAAVTAPTKLTLTLAIEGTAARNSHDLWIYPEKVSAPPGGVVVTRVLDDAARQALQDGRSVLLLPDPASLPKSIEGSFATDFWNWGMFKTIAEERHKPVAPGTLGILCDPKHPALAQFPTDFHSDWQWFHLLMNSRALILDPLPAGFRPVVQVIDNFERSHKLGLIFEAKVGGGNCSSARSTSPASRPAQRPVNSCRASWATLTRTCSTQRANWTKLHSRRSCSSAFLSRRLTQMNADK